jgi:predicted deacylase
VRDYQEYLSRLADACPARAEFTTVGMIDECLIPKIVIAGDPPAEHRGLLIAGVHGDEPAGPEAVIEIIEALPNAGLKECDLHIFPCLNPWGFANNVRENKLGIDVNRAFERSDVAEVGIVKQALADARYIFALDLHEDWEAKGTYLYEDTSVGSLVGHLIIEKSAVSDPSMVPHPKAK